MSTPDHTTDTAAPMPSRETLYRLAVRNAILTSGADMAWTQAEYQRLLDAHGITQPTGGDG